MAAQFQLSSNFQPAGDQPQAIEAFRESIKMRPSFSQPYLSLGITYSTMGNRRAAMDICAVCPVHTQPVVGDAGVNLKQVSAIAPRACIGAA